MKLGMIMMGVLFVLLRRLNKVQGDRLPVWELYKFNCGHH